MTKDLKRMAPGFRKAIFAAFVLVLPCVAAAQVSTSAAREFNGAVVRSAEAKPTGRIVVRWQPQTRRLSATARTQKAALAAGVPLKVSATRNDAEIFALEDSSDRAALEQAVNRLANDPDVQYASAEYWRKPHALTNDPLLLQQWYLLDEQAAATRSNQAWDLTQGSPSIVVAVLDTGVRPDHPDLQGKLLPGHDFVSHPLIANDGDQIRDSDASDPGDWVTRAEVQQSPNDVLDDDCLSNGQDTPSSWHGTRVAGLIGAQTNNASGVAGNAWNTQILPVRVMGKCGGRDFDIMDGMRWAAGIPVDGLTNPNPAHVINLSLGGAGACTAAYQSTVNEIIARGVLIVASAGNEGTAVSAPANCNGVLGVAGIRHIGTKVGFSNLGPQVGIAAPGGNCVNTGFGQPCLFSIVVATNLGSTTPAANGYTDQLNFNVGTSFSAPMAASAAALLRAVNTSLTPAQTILLLKATALPFPTNPAARTCTVPSPLSAPQAEECNCTTSTCGAGMLNTGAAVAAALRPLAVLQTTGAVAVGATISIDGANSFASQGRTIAAHQWSIANVVGATPTIANTSQAVTALQIPGESQFTLRLTVIDDAGAQDAREIALSTPSTAPPPPAPVPTTPSGGITNSGGGGGGALLWQWLGLMLLMAAVRKKKRLAHSDQ